MPRYKMIKFIKLEIIATRGCSMGKETKKKLQRNKLNNIENTTQKKANPQFYCLLVG